MSKLKVAGAILALMAAATGSHAQEFPSKAVKIVVSSGAGSLPDVLARSVSEQLSKRWGQPVVVENRPGAAYAIAGVAVSRSAPDGYTLIASEIAMFTYQHHLYKQTKRPFDGSKDFEPVSGLAQVPVAFIAHPSVEANTIADLIKLAKQEPGALNYGTGGPGTTPHLAMLMLERIAGIKSTPVHYRSVPLALNDVVAGHVQLLVIGPSIALENYRAGKLKMLGVGGTQRLPQLPNVPAVSEAAPGYAATVAFGIAAPANTPAAIVNRINADIQAVIKDPEYQKRHLDPQLLQPMVGSAPEFKNLLLAEEKRWEAVIRETGLSID